MEQACRSTSLWKAVAICSMPHAYYTQRNDEDDELLHGNGSWDEPTHA